MSEEEKLVRVRDLSPGLAEALMERGFPEDAITSPTEAVAQWCAWHLGDTAWGYNIISHYKKAVLASEQNETKTRTADQTVNPTVNSENALDDESEKT